MVKRFKEFILRTILKATDYIVGYDGDTGEEIRIKASDMVQKGEPGASADIQFSANTENWHFPSLETDIYIRFRVGNGAWSVCRFVGKDGKNGIPGISAFYSADAQNWNDQYQEGDKYIQFQLTDNSYTLPIRIVGADGITPNFQIGTVTTIENDELAKAEIEGTKEEPILNLWLPKGKDGAGAGTSGTNGWSPVLSIETDGERRVLRMTDYVGGTGTKPSIPANNYITASGLGTLANAIDIRGSKGNAGVVLAGNPYDFLITDNSGTVTWQTGYLGLDVKSNSLNINTYAKKIVINYNYSQENVSINFYGSIFTKNMQDCKIVIYNNSNAEINVTVNSEDYPIEWKSDGMDTFKVAKNKTKEVSLLPYLIGSILKIRGIVG